jgi:hypothetical protein
MLKMHKFVSLLSAIVLRKYVLTLFMAEKLRSAPADETGIVRTSCANLTRSGKAQPIAFNDFTQCACSEWNGCCRVIT